MRRRHTTTAISRRDRAPRCPRAPSRAAASPRSPSPASRPGRGPTKTRETSPCAEGPDSTNAGYPLAWRRLRSASAFSDFWKLPSWTVHLPATVTGFSTACFFPAGSSVFCSGDTDSERAVDDSDRLAGAGGSAAPETGLDVGASEGAGMDAGASEGTRRPPASVLDAFRLRSRSTSASRRGVSGSSRGALAGDSNGSRGRSGISVIGIVEVSSCTS